MRACIKNKQATRAWKLYLKVDNAHPHSYELLNLLANDSYKSGQFVVAAKSFDVLERLESTDNDGRGSMFDGKMGACIGWFQQIIAGEEPKESLVECMMILSNSNDQQAEYIMGTMRNWAEQNGLIPE